MDSSRRDFPDVQRLSRRAALRLLGTTPLLAALPACSEAQAEEPTDDGGVAPGVRLGPWPSSPEATRMKLWCEGVPGCVTTATVTDQSTGSISTVIFDATTTNLHIASLENLTPGTSYSFRVIDAEGHEHLGSFRTLPLASGIVELAIGADIHPWSKPYTVFDRIREAAPHVYLGLGDQMYADVDPGMPTPPTPDGYAAVYYDTWNDSALRGCWANVPAVLVWDDHEIWNDYDGSFGRDRFPAAQVTYRQFQRSRQESTTPWTILPVGPAEVFILDTRTSRDANGAPDGPTKSMLGTVQFDAVTQWLASSTAKVRIVASPTPFCAYATTGHDAWAFGFASERDRLFAAIAASDPSTVVLVSGDQHWPGVFRHTLPGGATVYELMATPVAAFFRPPPSMVGADALYVGANHVGYGSLVVDGRAPSTKVDYRWIDASGATRYSLAIL